MSNTILYFSGARCLYSVEAPWKFPSRFRWPTSFKGRAVGLLLTYAEPGQVRKVLTEAGLFQ